MKKLALPVCWDVDIVDVGALVPVVFNVVFLE